VYIFFLPFVTSYEIFGRVSFLDVRVEVMRSFTWLHAAVLRKFPFAIGLLWRPTQLSTHFDSPLFSASVLG